MTPLYHRIMAHSVDNAEQLALSHKVWDPTPWVIDVFTGGAHRPEGMDRIEAMRDFCIEHFGPESWPIHDRPARWMFGSATVDGWTWMGFATEEMTNQFLAKFPQEPVPT